MKKLSLLLTSVLLFSACATEPAVPSDEPAVPSDESENPESVPEATMLLAQGILFDNPDEWDNLNHTAEEGVEKISFRIPDEKYEVELEMDIRVSEDEKNPENYPASTLEAEEENVQVYMDACGGTFACYALHMNGSPENEFVLVSFQISSNEPVPENLDGVWSPSTELTREELINFLATAELLW